MEKEDNFSIGSFDPEMLLTSSIGQEMSQRDTLKGEVDFELP